MYSQIVNFHLDLLGKNEMGQEEIIEFMRDITKKLLIWGSDNVINKWADYRSTLLKRAEMEKRNKNLAKENMEGIFQFEKLLLAIREDMGHKNKKIKNKGKLLSLFINDVDDYV